MLSKKLILVPGLVFFFLGGNFARADVVINEFVSHPNTGEKEWVELFSTDLQDLTNWSLTDLASPGTDTQHENPMKDLAGLTIPAGEFLVVEVSSLNDGGDSIGLYNGTTFVDRVTYGANGTKPTVSNFSINLVAPSVGKSGALISNTWETNQDPTKGTQNPNSPPTSPVDDSSNSEVDSSSSSSSGSSSSSSGSVSEPKPKVIENPTMKVKISTNVLAFAGQPLEMQTSVVGLLNEKVVLGKAYWNFGDGSSFEQINNFEKFSHIYYYPGEYVLFLEYYQNSFSKTPEATAKMMIKVLPTTVSISKVGDAKDFFIELSNNASSDIDISNWVINASGKIFILPKNSVITSKKQMTISGKITGFLYGDQSNLKLYSGTGELIFDYSSSGVPAKVAKTVVSSTPSSILPLDKGEIPKAEGVYPDATQASVISSGTANNNPNDSYLPILISIIFIGASASTVYFIRRKKILPKEGNDFEILDE